MSLIDRVTQNLKDRRDNILKGEINCIPSPFSRFKGDFPGIEKDMYYLISGATKSSKTQLTNYLFVYTPILYAYNNPSKLNTKIFYYPLEETPENITLRFISYLLYTLYKVRISPLDLKSTREDKIVPEEVLNLINSAKIQDILKFYEEHVIFLESRNPTGVWMDMTKYAKETGTIHTKTVEIKNKYSGIVESREIFDYYEPKDPKEYVLIIVDHVSLIETERGMNLRESINKLSEYMMILRNKYHYIPVLVQQQSTETSNLEAYKAGKIKATMAGLSDSKYTGKDCSLMLGITNPYAFEIPNYLDYDITKLRQNFRCLEVVLNRNGVSNGTIGLYFDGAANFFNELPPPNDTVGLEKVYHYIKNLNKKSNSFMMIAKNIINRLHFIKRKL